VRYPVANTLTGLAIRERRVVMHPRFSDFIATMPDDHPLRALTQGFGVGAIILVPLIAQHEVIGVLTSLRLADAPLFSMRDERRLRVIADHAAVALRKSQLFEAVDAANQAKTAFLATISHELRTPLTALTGYGELLADEILGALQPAQLDMVERMRAVTNHLAVMIDEILSYTNLEAGRERVVVTAVAPDALARDVCAAMEPRARAHGLQLRCEVVHRDTAGHETEVHSVLPTLQSDGDKLRQVIANLCDNAIKFTPRGGMVWLRVIDAADMVCFEVRDSGIGIAATRLSEIFQPFKQLDSGLTRRYGGAGLGLHISQQLAALLGGWVGVESVLGEGSVFRVVIPRA